MKNTRAEKGTIRRIVSRLGRYRALVALSALLALVSASFQLYIPVVIGQSIDLMVGAGRVDLTAVGRKLALIAVLALAASAAQWVMNALNNRVAYRVSADLRDQAFEHLQTLPLSYLDSHPPGETVSRIISDVDRFTEGLLLGFTQLFTGVVTIVGTLVFMLVLDWRIALLVVLLTPLSLFIARFIARRTYSMFRSQSVIRAEQTSLIDELVGSLKIVKAFSYEKRASRRFDEINDRLRDTSLKAVFFSSLTNPTTRFVNSVIYALVALAGGLIAVFTGGLTVGGLATLLAYVNQYTKPFNEISGVVTEFQNALACAARIFELIEQPSETPDAPDAVPMKDVKGAVELRDVEFSYVPEKPLIRDLELSVAPGTRVAIVGPTGCGKTTLINLLMRFYDVDEGAISVDGREIRSLTRSDLRSGFGMVLQDTWIKHATVFENLRLGKPDATMEEVVAAAENAHIHHFITTLENGYDTVIDDSETGLSQGQKQLLCIARVMLCQAPMLILDEATSSIDTRTERDITAAFDKMTVGRTSFVVAHRLSTVMNADIILVMKDGVIVERGTHGELLARGGLYSELYNSQLK